MTKEQQTINDLQKNVDEQELRISKLEAQLTQLLAAVKNSIHTKDIEKLNFD